MLLNCYGEKNDVALCAKNPRLCCVDTVAQAEAYATGSALPGRGLARRSLC